MIKFSNFMFYFFMFIQTSTSFCQTNWKGTKKIVDGVPTVFNTNQPILSTPSAHLEQKWSVGGEDPGFIMNVITTIDVDENGKVYVADVSEKNIKVLSSDGKHLITFGRQGQGPGEFDKPLTLSILSNNQILVIDVGGVMLSTFNIFDLEGSFIDRFDIELREENEIATKDKSERSYLLATKIINYCKYYQNNTLILFAYCIEEMKYQAYSLWTFDMQHKKGKKFFEIKKLDPLATGKENQNTRDYLKIQWCYDKKGNIYIVKDPFDYSIEIITETGVHQYTIQRDFKLPKKSKEEYEKDLENGEKYMEQGRKFGKKILWKTLRRKSIIFYESDITRSLFCDDQNRLWVLTNEPYLPNQSTGVFNFFKREGTNRKIKPTRFTWDVFDSEGKYLMKVPFDAIHPRCFVYKDGYLYFAALKDDGFPWIFKYKIQEINGNK